MKPMGRDEAWMLPAAGIAAGYAVLAFMLKVATGYPGMPNGVTSLKVALFIVVLTGIWGFLRYLFDLWRGGEGRPSTRMIQDFLPAVRGFATIVAGVAIMSVFLYSITLSKSMIPAVVPFWADGIFAATDRALWINSTGLAKMMSTWLPALGVFYGLWHAAHLGGILWVLHWRRASKARHILSFMLTWTLGMMVAYIFSSMGPIFTGLYDPALAPESVRAAADFLLANYRGDEGVIGGGISAFPSMHVAIAAWLTIVLADRGWLKIGVAYFFGVFACSVILGWHYAIDGVAGAAIAIAADRLAKAWLSRGSSQTAATQQLCV